MTFNKISRIALGAAVLLGIATNSSYANPSFGGVRSLKSIATSNMATSKRMSAPFGHVIFCKSNRSQCRNTGSKAKQLTSKSWRQLATINARINRNMKERNDRGPDSWNINGRYGDCEDFALTKRNRLLKAGWSSGSLLITTGYLPNGIYHAVLVARTDHGDYVLDNLSGRIKPWNKVSYRWKKQQTTTNPRRWVRVTGRSSPSLAMKTTNRGKFSEPTSMQKNKRAIKKITKAKTIRLLRQKNSRLSKAWLKIRRRS